MLMRHHHKATTLEEFVTIEEAMRESGYTGQYLRRMAKTGKVRAVKRGHFWLVDLHSLRAYARMTEEVSQSDKRYGPREEGGDPIER